MNIVKVIVPDNPSQNYFGELVDKEAYPDGMVGWVVDERGTRPIPVENLFSVSCDERNHFIAEREKRAGMFGAIPSKEHLGVIGAATLRTVEEVANSGRRRAIESVKQQLKKLNELTPLDSKCAQSRASIIQNSSVTIRLTDQDDVNRELVELLCDTYSQENLASFCEGPRWSNGLNRRYDPRVTCICVSTIPIVVLDGSMV